MRVLIACEFSGRVRDAFLRAGHDAMSCDLLPSEVPGPHYQGDVFDLIDYPFDLMVAHPPCTDIAVSGARYFASKQLIGRQQVGAAFFMSLYRRSAHIPRVALENPVSVIATLWCKPDQIIHPWMFGHGESKATCLWLRGLPLLQPTNIVDGRVPRIHKMPPSSERAKKRSKTYYGVALAMALQWGGVPGNCIY